MNIQFGGPELTFELVSNTEMISKYILDYSWVIPAQFPYKNIFQIDLNRATGHFFLTGIG